LTHEYVRILRDREPQVRGAYVRPRPAATLMLVDRTGPEPSVLMGRRHESVKFMPGKFVFPGGGIEPGDSRMAVAGALPALVEERLMAARPRATAARARAIALAAIRETFEETGILLGSRDYGTPDNPPPGAWSAFASEGVYPDLEGLHLVARAITPPGRVRRFDTAFFAVDAAAIAGRVDGIVGPKSELVEIAWVPLSQAEAFDLPLITRIVLRELDDRLQAGLSPFQPVPFYCERHGKWERLEL
jgi:8-oxo-dGTP pyrophosphatase MutT (NUDIX family)